MDAMRLIPEVVVPGRRLGRHVQHDPRSRDYPYRPRRARKLSSLRAVHHRHFGGSLDQGELGSCTGEALVGARNTAPLHPKGAHVLRQDVAVEVYGLATRLDEFPGEYPPDDTGSSGLAACKAAVQLGLIAGYEHAFGIDEALLALQERAVMTGVAWYEGMDYPDAHGLVEATGQIRGAHEFVMVGYEPHGKTAGEALVEAVQSWGVWGLGGRFRMQVATWAALLADQGDVTIPI